MANIKASAKTTRKILVSKAYARYIRVSPRKTRQVTDLIRGEKVIRALAILANINKGAKVYVEKVLRSALSNARQNPQVLPEELIISKITADIGPTLKRYRAAAMGRATMIRHRMTHLSVELSRDKAKKRNSSLGQNRPGQKKVKKSKG